MKISKCSVKGYDPQLVFPIDSIDFHVFQWILHSGQVDLDDLVQKARTMAEKVVLDNSADYTVEERMPEELSCLVAELLEEWLNTWIGEIGHPNWVEADTLEMFRDPDNAPEVLHGLLDLFGPLIVSQWRSEVCSLSIAEAILRTKGLSTKPATRVESV